MDNGKKNHDSKKSGLEYIQQMMKKLEAESNGRAIRFPVKVRFLLSLFFDDLFCNVSFLILFLQLMCILDSNAYDDVCSWSPDGKSFVIFDQSDFVDQVLAIHYKGTKYSSFQRKVSRSSYLIDRMRKIALINKL